jgi:hypothetical protein
MPDITLPQIVALVIAGVPIIATLLRAFGVYDLSVEQEKALSDALTWAGVLAGSLIGGDAILRTGRNLRKGQVEAALVSDPSQTPGNMAVENTILVPVAADGTGTTYQTTPPVNPATKLPQKG